MTLDEGIKILQRAWWLVLACVLATVAVAGLLCVLATPEYSSSTRLFVSTSGDDTTSTALAGNQLSQARVASYVQLLTGQRLAGEVIDELGLDMTPGELAEQVTASTATDTVLIDVVVTDPSPQRARDIAATYSAVFQADVSALETPAGATLATIKVTEVESAQVADSPTSPDVLRNIALGVGLGLLLGVGAAFLKGRFNNTVQDADDVEAATGVGLVGALLDDPAMTDGHVLTQDGGFSSSAEAYRQIRTNLQFIDVDDPATCIVVSSALPGDGKTTVAINLALVIAQSGAKVTLIEADLRRPRVTRYLGLISGAGLSNVLAGNAPLDEMTQRFGTGRLDVLAAGPMPTNPSEVLGSRAMEKLLAELRRTNDFVIIDAPPLLPVTDGAVLAKAADGAVLVVRHGVTTHAQLAQAAHNLTRIDARLLGVVLNRMPATSASEYGYGYGYSYSAESEFETGVIPRVSAASRQGRERPPVPAVVSARAPRAERLPHR